MTFETKEYSVRLRRQEEIIAKDIKCPEETRLSPRYSVTQRLVRYAVTQRLVGQENTRQGTANGRQLK